MTIEQETREAFRFAEHLGARCLNLKLDVLQLPEIVRNDKWRCYHCKKYLFTEILRAAAENGFRTLLDGANVDDSGDWRPGARAADELGVLHPFVECGFGKRRIRLVSRRMGLASWTMPAAACLASRIPTGIPLTDKGDASPMRRGGEHSGPTRILRLPGPMSGRKLRVAGIPRSRIVPRVPPPENHRGIACPLRIFRDSAGSGWIPQRVHEQTLTETSASI